MTEARKTLTFAGVAMLLVIAAWVTAPRTVTPGNMQERGQPFFP